MRRVPIDGLSPSDQAVLKDGGGIARTPGQYARLSTGWHVTPVGEGPYATVVRVWAGESMMVVHCSGTPVSVRRGAEHLDTYGDWLKMALPTAGALKVAQAGRSFEVLPNELASLSYRHEFELIMQPDTSMFLIYLSAKSLRSRGLSRKEVTARKWGEGPLLPTLVVLLEQLFAKHNEIASLAVENALFEVTANAVLASSSDESGTERLRARTVGLIGAHFHDPNLNADWLADELGISRRNLYGLASQGDASIADMIRARRISHARQLLESQPDLPLPSVARRSGFRGPDQLARAFKNVVGLTPSGFRATVGESARTSS